MRLPSSPVGGVAAGALSRWQPVEPGGEERRHAGVRDRPPGPSRPLCRRPSGPIGTRARDWGVGSASGAPVIVEGRLWGLIVVRAAEEEPLPPGIEARLASFTELVAMAIANAESRARLARLAEEQAALAPRSDAGGARGGAGGVRGGC